jgi:hypothetical protein
MSVHSSSTLVDTIVTRLGQQAPVVGPPPGPLLQFRAKSDEVGSVAIYDDGDEVTIYVGKLTHAHFPRASSGQAPEHSRSFEAEVADFLESMFSDRVLVWTAKDGGPPDGWHDGFDGSIPGDLPVGARLYVWSGRLR